MYQPLSRLLACLATTAVWAWPPALAAPAAAELPFRLLADKDRMEMLKAYHARLSQPRPVQAPDLKSWDARRTELRRRILDGIGLDPLPASVPLNPVYGDKLERADCTVTRVAFQSFPGLYTTCFLYLPRQAAFPVPAVLHPHGHWANWSADDVVRSRCLGLAKRGYVSLAVQYEHFEDLNAGITQRGVFVWNLIRALDFLQSLPQVDGGRIGVTGASGGGLQSMMIAALDDRVKVAAIGVYPTCFREILYAWTSGCRCNYAPLGALRYTDQQEILALIAPKPATVFTVTGDWTANFVTREFNEVAPVFDLFPGEAGPVVPVTTDAAAPYQLRTSQNRRFLAERWPGQHDYTKAMRERMYWWMDWWLKGKHEPAPGQEEELAMGPVSVYAQLRVAVPAAHGWSDANLAAILRPARLYTAPELRTPQEVQAFQRKFRQTLTDLLGEAESGPGATANPASAAGRPQPGRQPGEDADGVQTSQARLLTPVAIPGSAVPDGWAVNSFVFPSEPDVRVPAFLITPSVTDAKVRREVTIALLPNGRNDAFVEPWRSRCREILAAGRVLLAMDQRLRGEWAWKAVPPGQVPENTWYGNSLVWGRPEAGMAVADVRAAITWIGTRPELDTTDVQVAGWDAETGLMALLAAALDERIAGCVADLGGSGYGLRYGVTSGPPRSAPILPNILRHGDIGEIAALVAPRSLTLRHANPRTSLAAMEAAFRLLGANGKLQVERGEEGAESELRIANGGFDEGTAGWTVESGQPISLCTTRFDLGKACLQLESRQVVRGETLTVKPCTAYRLFLHVLKPGGATPLELFLVRGDGKRAPLGRDHTDRMQFEECVYEFAARPGETQVRLGLLAPGAVTPDAPILVDTVRVVELGALPPVTPDGKELLEVADPAKLPPGPFDPLSRKPGTWGMGYGPGSIWAVLADGGRGRPAMRVKSGPNNAYAMVNAALAEPLRRGGLYRFTATVRGQGRLTLNFVSLPNGLSPHREFELTAAWATQTVDLFVESPAQERPVPTANITGEAVIESLSFKAILPEVPNDGTR